MNPSFGARTYLVGQVLCKMIEMNPQASHTDIAMSTVQLVDCVLDTMSFDWRLVEDKK